MTDPDSLLSFKYGLGVKEFRVPHYKQLTNELNRHNIDGKRNFSELREYAVGFSLTRFKINNATVGHGGLDYNVIDAHVLLCMITMSEANAKRRIQLDVHDNMA